MVAYGIGQSTPTATAQLVSPSVSLAPKMESQPEDTVSQW